MQTGGRLTNADVLKMKDIEFTDWPELRLTTDEQIRKFIAGNLSNLSNAQLNSVLKRLYPKPNARGGALGTPGTLLPLIDPHIEVFVEALDTIHDFYDKHTKQINPSIINALRPYKIPKGLKDHELFDEWQVIHFMSHTKMLTFRTGRKKTNIVQNPIYVLGLDSMYKYPNYDADMDKLYQRQVASLQNRIANGSPFIHVDMQSFSSYEKLHSKAIRFVTLLDVCWAVQKHFGDHAVFAADNGFNPAVHLVVRVFKIRSLLDVALPNSDKWACFSTTLRERILSADQNTWHLVNNDAHVFDAPPVDTRVEFDERPTGYVNQSVSLGGGTPTKIRVALGGGAERELTKSECMEFSQSRSINAHINMDLRDPPNFSITQWLDFKRAGDLGQIMNAKRYGRVLITSDKYMAMMAYMHRTPFILMRERAPIFKEHIIRNITTFTMYRP